MRWLAEAACCQIRKYPILILGHCVESARRALRDGLAARDRRIADQEDSNQ